MCNFRSKNLDKLAKKMGFYLDRSKGSHRQWVHGESEKRVTVNDRASKDMSKHLYRRIERALLNPWDFSLTWHKLKFVF